MQKWDKIPDDTDILVTHTPPVGHGDLCCTGVRAGCVELLTTVQQRVKPKYHVFGHIHEGEFLVYKMYKISSLMPKYRAIIAQNRLGSKLHSFSDLCSR